MHQIDALNFKMYKIFFQGSTPPDPPTWSGVRRIPLTFFTHDLFACLGFAGCSRLNQHLLYNWVSFNLTDELV